MIKGIEGTIKIAFHKEIVMGISNLFNGYAFNHSPPLLVFTLPNKSLLPKECYWCSYDKNDIYIYIYHYNLLKRDMQ